jgi:hypothetical protein
MAAMNKTHPVPLDAETKAAERPVDHKAELKLWLRLLTCCNLIEAEIRRRLQARFAVTLPRFDLLAQLDKVPDGLTLGETSRRMMVSNANVTTLVGAAGRRRPDLAAHRPARPAHQLHQFDAQGRTAFAAMARAHETVDRRAVPRPRRRGSRNPDAAARQDQGVGRAGDRQRRQAMSAVHAVTLPIAGFVPQHFLLAVEGGIATVTLNRPERKNPLTFDSYSELRDMFYALQHDEDVRAVVLTGAGRQLLLRRRRLRDHRPPDEARHEGPCSPSPA